MKTQTEKADTKKYVKDGNTFSNGFTVEINTNGLKSLEHTTIIDLSNKDLATIDDNLSFPPNLLVLNLSHNKLIQIPSVVYNLDKLQRLDVSYNQLKYFDGIPKFCHTIEVLNVSHNCLCGPPLWIWTESPTKLIDLDLSFNVHITDNTFEELLQYKTHIINLKINNCCLNQHLKLISTFPKAKTIHLGSEKLSQLSMNKFVDVPCIGLETCCDIESLNLSNTHLYNIKSTIDIFSSLVEINLSDNYLWDLPREFCNLRNLKTCILSHNKLLYLPDDIGKLQSLVTLSVDNNDLCMLPNSIAELPNLQHLDIYNNCLYEIPENITHIAELDCAQNYFDEPENTEYVIMKGKLREGKCQRGFPDRFNGRKMEPVIQDSKRSPDTSDDESYLCSIRSCSNSEAPQYDPPSSPEDWDSDDYWVPQFCGYSIQLPHLQWQNFVKRKMEEGHFCPADMHRVSIAEKVEYEKFNEPKIEYESDGQFDDFSDDDS